MSRPTIGRGAALLKALQEKKKSEAEAEKKKAELEAQKKAESEAETRTSLAALKVSEGASAMPTSEIAPPSGAETAPPSGSGPSASETTPPKVQSSPPKSPSDPSAEPQRQETVVRKGSAGMPIDLAANFVRIQQAEGRSLHEYVVTMLPNVDELK